MTPDPLAAIRAEVARWKDLPPPLTEVKLTRGQIAVIKAAASPKFVAEIPSGAVGCLMSVSVRIVATVEESTPYEWAHPVPPRTRRWWWVLWRRLRRI